MRIIENLQDYIAKIPDGEKVLEFLSEITSDTPTGIHVFNDNVYVKVVSPETKKEFDGTFECHRDYIDLQVVLNGEERIYYCEKKNTVVVKEYDKNTDCEFVRAKKFSYVDYTKMQGIELLPGEPHMGNRCIEEPQKIFKVVVKIRA